MHEIDKEAFAAFLGQLRKEQGLTQKELADKLYISDKAISKWERALSLPDISLLMPLSEILGVTVTELLEGRKLETEEITAEQAEALVQKALSLEEGSRNWESLRRKILIFTVAALTAFFEILLADWWLTFETIGNSYSVFEGLSFLFGIYFWFFLPERIPGYYDENEIGFYSDGFLRLNLPGVAFNNSNWPRVVKALRLWSIVTMIMVPLAGIWVSLLSVGTSFALQVVSLLVYLGSLFVPVYCAARNPGKPMKKQKRLLMIRLHKRK